MNRSIPLPTGLKEAENLTGQVFIPVNSRQFWGSYSCVYLGRYGEKSVAAKVIKEIRKPGNQDSTSTTKRKLKREMTVWATMNHRNTQPLYGFAEDQAFLPFGALISPWCMRGDAAHFMSEHGESMLVAERINLWKGVMDGVVYLHRHEPIIIHGDLKPGNILIDDTGIPKICDFGLAQIVLDQGSSGMTTTSEHTGTTRYLAPELVNSEVSVPPTAASDVYALGCLGLDFMYLQQPFANRQDNSRGHIFKDLRDGLPPFADVPPHQWPSGRAWSLMTDMWHCDPEMRPTALTASRLLTATPFTLSSIVLKDILDSVGAIWSPYATSTTGARLDRTKTLCALSLVSKATRAHANALLYKHIYLDVELQELSTSLRSSSVLKLIEAISSSAMGPSEGYGSYTETIVLHISGTHSMALESRLATQVSDTLSMMPWIRVIHLLTRSGSLFFNPSAPLISSHPLTTLDIMGMEISFLLNNYGALHVLSCVQRLNMRYCRGGQENLSRLSNAVFPVLQQVVIYGMLPLCDRLTQDAMLSAMTIWKMPRLNLLSINYFYSESKQHLYFLQQHGALLRHINIRGDPSDAQMVVKLLGFCPALQSLLIYMGSGAALRDFPIHHALETITIVLPYPILEACNLTHVLNFKPKAQMTLPGLRYAKFELTIWRGGTDIAGTATFRQEDDFTSLKMKGKIYRFYEGETYTSKVYLPPYLGERPSLRMRTTDWVQ